MAHEDGAGKLEIDHFDPRKKKDLIQEYRNLFPCSRACNLSKGKTWPKAEEKKMGCRFLNPCEELDYGEQIFEDHKMGELIGVNRAAAWHIRKLDLNSPHLKRVRLRRTQLYRAWARAMVKVRSGTAFGDLEGLVETVKEVLDIAIPNIAAPPSEDEKLS